MKNCKEISVNLFKLNKSMTAIELKRFLIGRIAEIDDVDFLNAIKVILVSKTQSKKILISDELKSEIKESKAEYSDGFFVEYAQLNEEFEKWSNEE